MPSKRIIKSPLNLSQHPTTTAFNSRSIWIISFVHSTPHRWDHVILCGFGVLYQAKPMLAHVLESKDFTCCKHHSFCSVVDHNHLLASGSSRRSVGTSTQSLQICS